MLLYFQIYEGVFIRDITTMDIRFLKFHVN